VILRHGRENQRTVCNFGTLNDRLLYKKALLWQRNRKMPFSIRIEIYSTIARFSLRQHGFLVRLINTTKLFNFSFLAVGRCPKNLTIA